jgi:hypothetical protein
MKVVKVYAVKDAVSGIKTKRVYLDKKSADIALVEILSKRTSRKV